MALFEASETYQRASSAGERSEGDLRLRVTHIKPSWVGLDALEGQ